jgi:hypothetical protein
MAVSAEADLLKTLPCVGKILSMTLMLEISKVERFPPGEHLASYAGLVPRVNWNRLMQKSRAETCSPAKERKEPESGTGEGTCEPIKGGKLLGTL